MLSHLAASHILNAPCNWQTGDLLGLISVLLITLFWNTAQYVSTCKTMLWDDPKANKPTPYLWADPKADTLPIRRLFLSQLYIYHGYTWFFIYIHDIMCAIKCAAAHQKGELRRKIKFEIKIFMFSTRYVFWDITCKNWSRHSDFV